MKGLKAVAQTLAVTCTCGGSLMDARNGSYMITSDTLAMECDTCPRHWGADALPKKASVFV